MKKFGSLHQEKGTELPVDESNVTLSDLWSKPGDHTIQAGWARNLSVIPLDLEEILAHLRKEASEDNK